MNFFDRLLALNFSWRDLVDILIVAVIIYNILAIIRGTRAVQMSIGLMLLASTFFIARAFDLPALEVISGQILFYLPFAIIILFQHEIRRGLARMGSNSLLAIFKRTVGGVPYDEIASACEILSAKRIGALVAIEGGQSLRALEEKAKPVDALLTRELLISIFTPGGPLHDGAVIVRGNRVVSAGAFLPLTSSEDLKLEHGTRHRAALGLSEESDAVIVVISEENGEIAIANDGVLREHLHPSSLAHTLARRPPESSGQPAAEGEDMATRSNAR